MARGMIITTEILTITLEVITTTTIETTRGISITEVIITIPEVIITITEVIITLEDITITFVEDSPTMIAQKKTGREDLALVPEAIADLHLLLLPLVDSRSKRGSSSLLISDSTARYLLATCLLQ